jgi:preprotein translocase subunit SecD
MVHEGGGSQPPQGGAPQYGGPQYGGPQYGGPQYGPPKRSRGPLVLVALLGVVLVAVLAIGAVVLLRNGDSKADSAPKSAGVVEFRRVVKTEQGQCATPAEQGVACDSDGNRYTLGKVEVDGSHVRSVKAESQDGRWYLLLSFDDEGKKLFSALTSELAQKTPPDNQIAIVVNGSVVTAPTVQSAITDGQVQISGTFTKEAAEKLANQITG